MSGLAATCRNPLARAMAAYEDVNCKHEGLITESVLDEISSGLLVEVTIPGGSYEGEHAELVRKSFEALASPKCRVSKLNLDGLGIGDEGITVLSRALEANKSLTHVTLGNNKLGDEAGKAIGKALELNSSITQIELDKNNLGDETGKAIGNALKVNSSIKTIDISRNKLGDEAGKAIGNALKVNTSIEEIE